MVPGVGGIQVDHCCRAGRDRLARVALGGVPAAADHAPVDRGREGAQARRLDPAIAAQVVTEPAWGDRVVLPRRRARRVRGVGQRHREEAADQLDRQQLQEGARRRLTRRGGREEAVDPSRLRGGEHRHGRGPVRSEIIRAQRRQPVRLPQSNGGVGDEGSRDDRASARAVAGVDLEPLRLGGQRHRPAPAHRVAEGGPGPLRRRKLCREVGQDQGHQPALAAEVGWEGVEETGRSHGPSIDRAHRAPLRRATVRFPAPDRAVSSAGPCVCSAGYLRWPPVRRPLRIRAGNASSGMRTP